MPALDQLEALAALAQQVPDRPGWQGLACYLERRATGLRRDALQDLDRFLDAAQSWPFEERSRLLEWLQEADEALALCNLLLPEPMIRRLATPTASERLEREPDSARAHYLYALFVAPLQPGGDPLGHLRRAAALDPSDQRVRTSFVRRIIAGVHFSQHELPFGYLDDVDEDLADLEDAIAMAGGIGDAAARGAFLAELLEQRETARSWKEFRSSGADDFEAWSASRVGHR